MRLLPQGGRGLGGRRTAPPSAGRSTVRPKMDGLATTVVWWRVESKAVLERVRVRAALVLCATTTFAGGLGRRGGAAGTAPTDPLTFEVKWGSCKAGRVLCWPLWSSTATVLRVCRMGTKRACLHCATQAHTEPHTGLPVQQCCCVPTLLQKPAASQHSPPKINIRLGPKEEPCLQAKWGGARRQAADGRRAAPPHNDEAHHGGAGPGAAGPARRGGADWLRVTVRG